MMYTQEIIQLLAEQHISYTMQEHPPVFTMEDMESLGLMQQAGKVCKNLFLRNAKKTAYYIVCMPMEKKIPLKELGMQIANAGFSFVSPECMRHYLGITPGSVSPLGVLNDASHTVQVVLDNDIMAWPCVGVHPNENTATIWIAPNDLIHLLQAAGHAVSVQNLQTEE